MTATGGAVPILMYHQVAPRSATGVQESLLVTPVAFARQMHLLFLLRWRSLRLIELVELLRHGDPLPHRRFVLTFDDAYLGIARHAVPVLTRLGFTATIFTPSQLVGTCHALDQGGDSAGKALMSWDDLRKLQAAGFDIGAHTRTHVHLPLLTSSEVTTEVVGSRDDIATALGQPAKLFAYPYGEWNSIVAATVHEAGFSAACATRFGAVEAGADVFALPRISVSAALDLPHFAYRLFCARRITRHIASLGGSNLTL